MTELLDKIMQCKHVKIKENELHKLAQTSVNILKVECTLTIYVFTQLKLQRFS